MQPSTYITSKEHMEKGRQSKVNSLDVPPPWLLEQKVLWLVMMKMMGG